jgi:DNA-directed RNA polymerase specialized sigma subunit
VNTYPEYAQYENLVYSAIHSVHREIGGNIDEMIACAGLLFVKAVNCYNDSRNMSLASWIRKVVWDDTYSARRNELVRAKYHAKGETDFSLVADTRSAFSLSELLEDLSQDARNLVELTLNPTDGIILKQDGSPKQPSLMAMARRMYGWSNEQLAEICQEIRESL